MSIINTIQFVKRFQTVLRNFRMFFPTIRTILGNFLMFPFRLFTANELSTKRRHSGHFRSATAEVWDSRPQYEFTAFGRRFRLLLAHDTSFVSPNIKVRKKIRQTSIHFSFPRFDEIVPNSLSNRDGWTTFDQSG